MYKFVNTNEKIQTSEVVLKELEKLNKLDGNFEVKICRGDESKGEAIFICKIKGGNMVKVSGGERPEYATRNCARDVIKEYRNLNAKRNDNKRRAGRGQREVVVVDDEGLTE